MVLGVVVLFAMVIILAVKEKRVILPSTLLIWTPLILPVVYIISAFASKTPDLSLFGYALEPGTAGSIVLLSAIFFLVMYVFRDRSRLIRVLTALFSSLAILAIFVFIKILSGGTWLTLSTFFGNMGNPVGSWTDLSVVFGLLTLLTIFAVEMLPLSGRVGFFVKTFYAISLFLVAVINFSTAWTILLGAGVLLLIYFATVERRDGVSLWKRTGVRMTLLLMVFSLVFIFNPNLGGKDVATIVSEKSGVLNSDVRPNLRSTLSVAKLTLSENPILGSGPNTFDKDWLLYKSAETNLTPFWNIAFPFGFGFLPTSIATTGYLGTAIWLAFLIVFLALGIKSLSRNQESGSDRFILISTFLSSLYLWISSIVYTPSLIVLALAFIFTGLFVGTAEAIGVISPKELIFSRSKLTSFATHSFLVVIALSLSVFSFVSMKKVLAASHFQRALIYSSTQDKSLDEIEDELGRAITTSPADQFWSAVSRVELSRANTAFSSTEGSESERQQIFQNSISASIAAMQNAINLNPTYYNWIALGNIYSSLAAVPLRVEGAYESAQIAYNNAETLHPLSPEVTLSKARLEFDHNNPSGARDLVNQAIQKKSDYADAYFFLSQLEISENNLTKSIESAETGALLSPGNPGVFFQLGLLKYSDRDYKGASEAFARAITLVPDYANAKYYLGLTLDRLDMRAEAIKQFEDLVKTNPDNDILISVLENLQAGRPALSEPQSSDTKNSLPIKGQ